MDSFEFSATSGALMGKTIAHVKVFTDRIVIQRDTKRPSIPKELTVFFADISSITYDENKANAWISFAVSATLPGSQLKTVQPVYAVRPGEIVITPNIKVAPFDEPYAIIFSKSEKTEAKDHYEKLLKLHQESHNQSKEEPASAQESALDKLKKLKELLDMGVLTESEYEEKRKTLLQMI